MLIGVAAAYLGGVWDGVLNLITDVLLVIPLFPLLIVIATYVQNAGTAGAGRGADADRLVLRRPPAARPGAVAAQPGLPGGGPGARRAPLYIILVEIIPTMTSLIVASFLATALYAVLFGSGLQFIGLGDPNSVSWGTMLYWAENNEALQTGQYLWAIVPGALIALLGAAFALLNYAFDEIGNPALRPVRRTVSSVPAKPEPATERRPARARRARSWRSATCP